MDASVRRYVDASVRHCVEYTKPLIARGEWLAPAQHLDHQLVPLYHVFIKQ